VVDGASPTLDQQVAEVGRVLEEIGAGAVPQLLVYNKCDRLADSRQPREAADWVELPAGVRCRRVFVSALKGTGLDVLRQALAAEVLARDRSHPRAGQAAESAPEATSPMTDPAEAPETVERLLPHQHA